MPKPSTSWRPASACASSRRAGVASATPRRAHPRPWPRMSHKAISASGPLARATAAAAEFSGTRGHGDKALSIDPNPARQVMEFRIAAMAHVSDELIRLTATEAVARLKRGDITPLELIDAAERRIAEVEPAINALPTLCFERAREHARRLMLGEGRVAEGEPGWLAGLPIAIKDLVDVAGVRTTYGSVIFKD